MAKIVEKPKPNYRNMTVSEIWQLKRECESSVNEAVREFEKKTGLCVAGINSPFGGWELKIQNVL